MPASARPGDGATVAPPLLAAGISLPHGDREGMWQLVKSEAATLEITEVLKAKTNGARRNGKDKRGFPSRHASVPVAAAQTMQIRNCNRYLWATYWRQLCLLDRQDSQF